MRKPLNCDNFNIVIYTVSLLLFQYQWLCYNIL